MPNIIGQPIIQGFTVTAVFTCPCEAKQIMTAAITKGMIFGCAACKQWYRVEDVELHDGQLAVALARVIVKPRNLEVVNG